MRCRPIHARDQFDAKTTALAPDLRLLDRPTSWWIEGGACMDDKIEGKWDQGKGKVKEEVGKLGGDKSTEIGGKIDQGKGKVKEGLGNLKEDLHDERVDR